MSRPTDPQHEAAKAAAKVAVLSGMIRTIAEKIVTRRERITNLEDVAIADQFDAQRIIELIEEQQACLLAAQLSGRWPST